MPKKNMFDNIIESIKNNIPFLESKTGKALRNDAERFYKFTPEATKLFNKKTFIKENAPEYDGTLPGVIKWNGRIYTSKPSLKFGGSNTPFQDGVKNFKLGKDNANGVSNIEMRELTPDIVAHELIHTAFDYGQIDAKEFNVKWDTLKNNDRRLRAIDDLLGSSSLYENTDSYSLANERFAYLGENLGVGGLKVFPKELQPYYSDLFR